MDLHKPVSNFANPRIPSIYYSHLTPEDWPAKQMDRKSVNSITKNKNNVTKSTSSSLIFIRVFHRILDFKGTGYIYTGPFFLYLRRKYEALPKIYGQYPL
jgi:hypothetical protein